MSPENSKIRVGVISSAPAPYRKGLFERLAKNAGLDLKVYFLGRSCGDWNWDSEMRGDFPQEYLELPRFISEKRYQMWLHPQIPGVLKSGGFDAVVVGGYFIPSFLLAIAWCRFHGVPYLLWSESHGAMQRSLLRKAMRAAIAEPVVRGAAAHLAVGSGAGDYLASMGVNRDRIFLVLNSPDVEGIMRDVEKMRPAREEWKREKGLGPGPVGLFVGRMTPDKGLDDLLDAYSLVAEAGNSFNMVLLGRGELLEPVRDRVRREGWRFVRVEGFVPPERVNEYYAMSDFLALPSRHEPFGAVVQEALAAGLPVVASSAVGAAADLVREGETGFVVPVHDAGKLAKIMSMLWSDASLCQGMRSKCVAMALKFDHRHGEKEFLMAARMASGGYHGGSR